MNTNHEMGVVGDSDGYDMATFEENGNEEREKESQTEEEGENLDNGSASVLQDEFIYSIEDSPSWHLSLLFGFQHYLTMFGSTLGVPLLLSLELCMSDNPVDVGKLIGTEFFVSGLATLLQTILGSRLPIVQGASLAFFEPSRALLRAHGACPTPLSGNATEEDFELRAELWRSRMRLLQGSILIACLVEVIIGFTGLIGLLLRFIGPLTVAPTLCLIGISLFQTAANFAGINWITSGTTIVLIVIFSQFLGRIRLPIPAFSSEKSCHVIRLPIFKVLPVVLSVVVAWILAAILTARDAIPAGSPGRTDYRANVLYDSPWFYIPHPFQWGVPVVTVAGVLGMIAGVLASTVESIGDYYACARVSGAPPPPDHAVNRGIGMEGIGCILAGFWGTGLGTTSYSQNIGVIGITKVGSRQVVQVGASLMILLGSFGKFGAFFATIPIPIIGGMFCILFGLVAAVGLSNLQFVNLNSSRNLFVLGVSLFMGLMIPTFIKDNNDIINTRFPEFNQIMTVLLSVNMFVGGVIAAFLDNAIPGTLEERGLVRFKRGLGQTTADVEGGALLKCYDLPFGMARIRRMRFFSYLPFSPTFKGFTINVKKCHRRRKRRKGNDGASVKYDAVTTTKGEHALVT